MQKLVELSLITLWLSLGLIDWKQQVPPQLLSWEPHFLSAMSLLVASNRSGLEAAANTQPRHSQKDPAPKHYLNLHFWHVT